MYETRHGAKIKAISNRMLNIDVSHTFLEIGINALTAMQKDFKVASPIHR